MTGPGGAEWKKVPPEPVSGHILDRPLIARSAGPGGDARAAIPAKIPAAAPCIVPDTFYMSLLLLDMVYRTEYDRMPVPRTRAGMDHRAPAPAHA